MVMIHRSHALISAGLALMAAGLLTVPANADFPLDECPLAEEAWVFCTAFEDGDFSAWDDYDGNPSPDNTLLENPGPWDVAGNHVARLLAPAGGGGADLLKVMPSSYDVLYARWYAYWEPGFDFAAGGHGSGLYAGERWAISNSGNRPDGTDRFTGAIEPNASNRRPNVYSYYRGMYQDCANPVGACWGDRFPCMIDDGQNYCTKPQHREDGNPPPVIGTGRWYCVEIMLDGGTPSVDGSVTDGVLNFWIDGEPYGPWDDLWLRTTPDLRVGILWMMLFQHEGHGLPGMLLDNVVVSTAPIGCRSDDVPAEAETWSGVKSSYR